MAEPASKPKATQRSCFASPGTAPFQVKLCITLVGVSDVSPQSPISSALPLPRPLPPIQILCNVRLALHGVHFDAMVQSPGVPPDRRLLRSGDGSVGGGVRILRDYQPVPALSGNQRAGPDRESSQGALFTFERNRARAAKMHRVLLVPWTTEALGPHFERMSESLSARTYRAKRRHSFAERVSFLTSRQCTSFAGLELKALRRVCTERHGER